MPKLKYRHGTCVYCGTVGDVSDDHVVPQCLWPSGKAPADAPVLDACPTCNHQRKSEDDTYLRDLLATDRIATQTPNGQKLIPKFERAKDHNRSIMARDFRDQRQVVERIEPSGSHIWSMISPEANARTRKIMEMIVRGLHQYYLHEPLPANTSFLISRLFRQEEVDALSKTFDDFGGRIERIGNGEVFECAFTLAFSSWYPHASIWMLTFYQRVVFFVGTNLVIREEIPTEITKKDSADER